MPKKYRIINRPVSIWLVSALLTFVSSLALAQDDRPFTEVRGSLSGSWYDPSRDGEGFVFEFSEIPSGTAATVYWFTHKDGEPYWLIGSTEYDPAVFDEVGLLEFDLLEVSGTGFGEDFEPGEIEQIPRGTISFVFEGCNSAVASWVPEAGSDYLGTETLEYDLQRITLGIDGIACQETGFQAGSQRTHSVPPLGGSLSGTWFDIDRNGEGFVYEFGNIPDSNILTVYWFTHKDGKPYWLTGAVSYPDDSLQIDVSLLEVSGTGFGTKFESDSLSRSEWGSINFGFVNCNESAAIWEGIDTDGSFDLRRITSGLDGVQCQYVSQPNSDFYLASNGITVMCPEAEFGESGWVNGIEYKKREKNQITVSNASRTCTSGITDMSYLFRGEKAFNADISSWDVSNVTNMNAMFSGALAFNQPLGAWDTSSVLSMRLMFGSVTAFNQDIGRWDTSSVNDMSSMFAGANSFNKPVGEWDTSAVTNMGGMFYEASAFNQDVGDWNVESVVNMRLMFSKTERFNIDIGEWNTRSVTDMASMFYAASSFNQDLSLWETGSVVDMSSMFRAATSFNQKLDDWDTSAVVDMNRMFFGTRNFNKDISLWDVSNARNMDYMFYQASRFNQDLSKWCVTSFQAKPRGFDDAADVWTLPRPQWGEPC